MREISPAGPRGGCADWFGRRGCPGSPPRPTWSNWDTGKREGRGGGGAERDGRRSDTCTWSDGCEINTGRKGFGRWPVDCILGCVFFYFLFFCPKNVKKKKQNVLTAKSISASLPGRRRQCFSPSQPREIWRVLTRLWSCPSHRPDHYLFKPGGRGGGLHTRTGPGCHPGAKQETSYNIQCFVLCNSCFNSSSSLNVDVSGIAQVLGWGVPWRPAESRCSGKGLTCSFAGETGAQRGQLWTRHLAPAAPAFTQTQCTA